MNNNVLAELKTQLTEVVGILSLVEYSHPNDDPSDDAYWIKMANAQLVGLVQGLGVIIDHPPTEEGFNWTPADGVQWDHNEEPL